MNSTLDNALDPYVIPEAFGRKYYDEIIGSYAAADNVGNILVPLIIGGIVGAGTYADFLRAWQLIVVFAVIGMVFIIAGLMTGPYRKEFMAQKAQERKERKEKKAALKGGTNG